ncbi:hypothetical protein [Streptomyces sp. NPDC059909]|uniref:hypothetical protein n=1 Tax=Streptomyces sp. NPDC059909 TaxID=3346998 RepID=UPI0036532051
MGAEAQKSTAATAHSAEPSTSHSEEAAASHSEEPQAPVASDSRESAGESGTDAKRRGPDRNGLVIAGATLAACAGLVVYGVINTPGSKPDAKAAPSAEVTYEVTGSGTVDISYRALGTSGTDAANTASGVRLPWKKTVDVPLGKDPVISIVLDEKGGQARCALAIRGRHVQSSTASGEFGRATCAGELPAPE